MKRILFLCFLLPSFLSANAQSWEELDKTIVQLSDQGKYQEAVSFAVKAMNLARTENGDSSLRYVISSCRFAYLHIKLGNTTVADATYNKAILRFGKLLNSSFNSGNYELAETVCKESLIHIQKIKGENHPDWLASLNNLAEIYRVLQKYEASEATQKKVIARAKIDYGDNHEVYAITLNNLATLYLNIGNYGLAEPLFKQAKEIRKGVLGTEHPDYAVTLNNLGELYRHMGNYEMAESLLQEALAINKKANGENHPHYISTLNNLAVLYDAMGKQADAEKFYKESAKKRLESLGRDHPDYATSLNNLAFHYYRTGNYVKALDLYAESMEITRKIFGNEHPLYADCLNSLASVAHRIGMDTTAELFFKSALKIYEDKLGTKSPDYTGVLINLALLNGDMHKFKNAEEQFASGIDLVMQSILRNFHILSEKEKMIWLKTKEGSFEGAFSLLFTEKDPSAAYARQSCTHQLQLKGLVLNDGIKILDLVRIQGDTGLKQLLAQWQTSKNLLAKQYSLPFDKRIPGIDSLENIANEIEKLINLRSSVFRNNQKEMQAGFSEVQKQLKADEAAIEFIRFDYYNKKWTDSILYGAFIIRGNEPAPQFVILCEEKQLLQLFESAGNTAIAMVSSFYRGLGIKNKNAATLGSELYNLVWKPLEKYLGGVKKIAYSPAGKLYSVAFHALPVDSTTVLMDRYQLQQYSSTRQIALRNPNSENKKPAGICLFGDAAFTMDSVQILKQKTKQEYGNQRTSIYTPQKRGIDNNVWDNLPGTGQEVEKIKELFDRNKTQSQSFTQVSASEENLKGLNGRSPQVLHIATHGFFLPGSPEKRKEVVPEQPNSFSMSNDALLRSGLILSGANYAWSGKVPLDAVEDGIVTAYEISQLNLSNTELVVLSACETALGEIKGNEGVFGLQRAFKMAGVKKMIVSLWQVPDKETAELMTNFYTNWMEGKTISDAFTQAQADMRKKYSPFYWAAFVLVE